LLPNGGIITQQNRCVKAYHTFGRFGLFLGHFAQATKHLGHLKYPAPLRAGRALRAPGRDGGGETEIGEDRAAYQVERDVELANVEKSERIGDKDSEHPEEQ
jgi:hypothetical protein